MEKKLKEKDQMKKVEVPQTSFRKFKSFYEN